MSSVRACRDALAKTVEAGLETEIFAYQNVPDVVQLPAMVILPKQADFAKAFQRGMDEWDFDVFLLVARTDTVDGQEELDRFITGSGPDSVRQIVYNNPDLGLPDTDAFVKGVADYGGEFQAARVSHVGAILKVRVQTDGAQ